MAKIILAASLTSGPHKREKGAALDVSSKLADRLVDNGRAAFAEGEDAKGEFEVFPPAPDPKAPAKDKGRRVGHPAPAPKVETPPASPKPAAPKGDGGEEGGSAAK